MCDEEVMRRWYGKGNWTDGVMRRWYGKGNRADGVMRMMRCHRTGD